MIVLYKVREDIVKAIMKYVYHYMDEHDVYTLSAWEIEEVLKDIFV